LVRINAFYIVGPKQDFFVVLSVGLYCEVVFLNSSDYLKASQTKTF